MKLSIVIPNFNGSALLKENLPQVQLALDAYEKKTGEKAEIIVTDDASTDDSHERVKSMTFPVLFLEHEKNAGFSTNVNRGVKQAKGEIVILLNTDVHPEKGFLFSLIPHFSDASVFAVGCMDKSIENGKEVLRGRGVGKWEKGFLVHSAGDIGGTHTLWASGGSSAFRRSLWDDLGGMDEAFNPFYWEDIDLSYRAWKAGYMVLFDKNSIVRHEHERGTIRTHHKNKIHKTAYRNQFLFVWKNASVLLILKHICWLPYHLIRAILRHDSNFLRGFFSAIVLLPKVTIERRKQRTKQKRSDLEVIELSTR